MYYVEFYNAADRLHDMRPIAADTERAARMEFHRRYILGAGWHDTVTITNITRKH